MLIGIFAIDEYVPIPVPAHRFSSGAAYQPTALTYSIYEEGSTTGIDEDVDMTPASPWDSITGCYLVWRQLTAAAGFEADKTYVVVVKATVDGVPAIDMHTFQIRPACATSGNQATIIANQTTINNNILAVPAAVWAVSTRTLTSFGTLVASVAAAVWDYLTSAILTTGSIGKLLKDNVDAILGDTGTTLPALISTLLANPGAGAGAIAFAYTLTDSADASPIDGAEVWVTTDAAGVNVVASGTTDAYGVVNFMLDAGNYYFWRKRSGYNFVNPDQETVSA